MKECILRIENLHKNFGGVVAVEAFNLEVHVGEFMGIIGPNGAGKTTIFNLISKIYEPDKGTIEFDGQDITNKSQIQVARMGLSRTFQNVRLFSGLSVLDNVKVALDAMANYSLLEAMFLLPRRWKREKETTRAAMECLTLLNLDEFADRQPGNLPYGLQRRVEIARALVSNPKLLMLDEPAAGLNPEEVFQLIDFLREIREKYPKTSIMIIEHRMDLVMNICEYIYVQDFGKTIAKGNPTEIQNNPTVIKAYLGVEA